VTRSFLTALTVALLAAPSLATAENMAQPMSRDMDQNMSHDMTAPMSHTASQNVAPTAADRYYDPARMAAARKAVKKSMGGQSGYYLQADRLEFQSNEGDGLVLWDLQGWYGGDINKLWLKSEGEYILQPHAFEEAEIQALYSCAILPFFDFQAGIRQDIKPKPSRTYAVIGIQGLAPYQFEIDAAAFISNKGDLSARIEAEYEILLTQRLILQPRAELNLSAQNVGELSVGAGLSTVETGLRLRYEIKRQIAPYIGIAWKRSVGQTADFARADGENIGSASVMVGLRLWY